MVYPMWQHCASLAAGKGRWRHVGEPRFAKPVQYRIESRGWTGRVNFGGPYRRPETPFPGTQDDTGSPPSDHPDTCKGQELSKKLDSISKKYYMIYCPIGSTCFCVNIILHVVLLSSVFILYCAVKWNKVSILLYQKGFSLKRKTLYSFAFEGIRSSSLERLASYTLSRGWKALWKAIPAQLHLKSCST